MRWLSCASVVLAVVAVAIPLGWTMFLNSIGKPTVDWNKCWTIAECTGKVGAVRTAELRVPDEMLEDLSARLGARNKARNFKETLATWENGIESSHLEEVLVYWEKEFDWRKVEKRINEEFNPSVVEVDGLDVHFWHLKAKDPKKPSTPLMMLHGWPGSVWEFNRVAAMLHERKEINYEIIVPSLPGYGWSQAPEKRGLDVCQMAVIFSKLMTKGLGFKSYIVQGGDWGSMIAHCLIDIAPEGEVLGIHSNMPIAQFPPWAFAYAYFMEKDPQEVAKLFPLGKFLSGLVETVPYFLQQMTRPASIGFAMEESPAATAAWILDKFYLWTDPRSSVSKDDLITNLMFYWLPKSQTSSAMLYKETFWSSTTGERVLSLIVKPFPHTVGISAFPREILPPLKVVMRSRYTGLVRLDSAEQGGHFAALENPKALAQHVNAFVQDLLRR